MAGVCRARFCHNRKDPNSTYLPTDALYHLRDGAPLEGCLDLCGWGVCDDDMPTVAEVGSSSRPKTPESPSSEIAERNTRVHEHLRGDLGPW